MTELLIHSMSAFSDIILDALHIAEARNIVEIGTEFGGTSKLLEGYAREAGGSLSCVDPSPKQSFTDWIAGSDIAHHVAMPSLEAFATLGPTDAWLVDGDHNWYTVYHELLGIDAASQRDGKPMLVFLHDVGWPCARRDQYCAPDRIPAEFRQPYSYDGGMVPGEPGLVPDTGFRGAGSFAAALNEGGPRNGVLTAIEDFLERKLAEGRELGFAEVPGVFGLGVVFDLDAPWSGAMADLLAPFHCNSLLAALERNRIANYLRVIEYQDMGAGR